MAANDGVRFRIVTGHRHEHRAVTAVVPSARYLTPKVRAFVDLALELAGSPDGARPTQPAIG